MTAKPNLPPLPAHVAEASCGTQQSPERLFGSDQMRDFYQLGRNAGLEHAALEPRAYAMTLDRMGWGDRFPLELAAIFNASTNIAQRIRALKSIPIPPEAA